MEVIKHAKETGALLTQKWKETLKDPQKVHPKASGKSIYLWDPGACNLCLYTTLLLFGSDFSISQTSCTVLSKISVHLGIKYHL